MITAVKSRSFSRQAHRRLDTLQWVFQSERRPEPPLGLLTSQTVSGAGPGSSATFSDGDTSGNPDMIQESHWDSTLGPSTSSAAWLTTGYQYDPTGNITQVTDPRQIPTTYMYDTDNV